MKEQRLEILRKVASGELTPEQADDKLLSLSIVGVSLPIESFDCEEWLGEHRDIWHHPYVSDRTNTNAYEVAQLMADFSNSIIRQ